MEQKTSILDDGWVSLVVFSFPFYSSDPFKHTNTTQHNMLLLHLYCSLSRCLCFFTLHQVQSRCIATITQKQRRLCIHISRLFAASRRRRRPHPQAFVNCEMSFPPFTCERRWSSGALSSWIWVKERWQDWRSASRNVVLRFGVLCERRAKDSYSDSDSNLHCKGTNVSDQAFSFSLSLTLCT